MAALRNSSLGLQLLKCYCLEIRCLSTISFTRPEISSIEYKQCVNTRHKGVAHTARRLFFSLPSTGKKKKEFSERKLVGFSMEEMYSVVSDVGSYTSFVPFCKRSDVLSHHDNRMTAKMVIGFPPVVESFTSSLYMAKPTIVKADSTDGRLFDHLTTTWQFAPGLKSAPRSCVVLFSVSFQFRSVLHSQLANVFFNEVVRKMEAAFTTEAARRFGRPAFRAQPLA